MRFQIQILIASYALLLLVFLISRKNKLEHNKIFSWFIGAVLLNLLLDIFSEIGILNDRTNFNSFIGFLYGPLLLFYVRFITNGKKSNSLINFVHFVPALIILLLQVLFYFKPSINNLPLWKFSLVLVIVHVLLYVFKVFHLVTITKTQKSLQHLHLWLSFLCWGIVALLFVFSLEVCIVLFEQYKFFTSIRILNLVLQFLYMNVMVYFGLTSFEIFNKKQKYFYSKLEASEKTHLISTIKKHMKENEPFLNFDFSLKLLSEQTGIDSAQLSQVINEHFNQNFKDFINSYRIKKAKKLLTSSEDMIIKEVMYDSGFQSKSTFNPVFKKHTGMTPSNFLLWWEQNNEK